MEKAAVTAVCWVPKGACVPAKVEAMQDAMGEAEQATDDAVAKASAAASALNHGLEEFDMDNYDEDEDNQDGMQFFSVLTNDGALAFEKDPHMTGDPDSESEGDLGEIRPEDNVFLAVSCEEDVCQLEVYVFDEENVSTYVHHDIMLTAYPLCVEWLSSAEEEGSYAAIGLIDHTLQIWDLQDTEALEPVVALGKEKKSKGKVTKKKNAPPAMTMAKAHDGPVLCMHGNAFNRNVLASGSADELLKVWDVSANKCVHKYAHHDDKVQCVRWHPSEDAVMLSAAFDKKLSLLDVRQPDQSASAVLPGEAECAIWSRHSGFECLASTDNGGVVCYDVRKIVAKDPKSSLWTLSAHDVACTGIQDCPTKDMLITCSLDGYAKVWNIANGAPSLRFAKDLKAGPLFACQSCPEEPALVCFGGRCQVLWDLTSEQSIMDDFGITVEAATDA
mmetsp:Transcript_6912/g.15753  ORF Transcript_6912/g.15753 Transcript_6912/m.15753 type:complete len:446 (-) Transcript_6912:148-1485(-)|eukprot:CAMPEP_0206461134 /NCGR_PEP_ID=MMETSP0324_2-20121206/25169_1 /ASSEMBLY_ACC=CAM_ASM_000836 /TAXON_ID=2866 /ORGANISM="Crypthecodinium cohnii, Strain Seligo" /LENGTH=445 /DNA_ID=CAMNT_0053932975 /DNA_START=175 /DNA_END=1512 /DNA_ORIENTATION=-